ncbi:hypothetical protein [Sandaracinus amylolyticus]|uniref:hypothetical protein n=2 Tax=Sandaracinus TaxID=1055688 RepID=UPI001AFB6025|nr:hypothetical protein [Sandaracinus amylolyticus]QRN75737.1 Hypothetical protein MSR10575_88240 [Sandaracinus sp.]UJR87222.1 Hypothetical protein I5071_130 [Sandaracinus amylolyticus]
MMDVLASLTLVLALVAGSPSVVRAQSMPACDGDDAEGASEAFEAGNALIQTALREAQQHPDRARELAEQALAHFDHQCELGDASALAERGAALMLMGEVLRSAQSYDAYLAVNPLEALDARTRRRIALNLQPGTLVVEVEQDAGGHLFVDELDFGALPRSRPVRLPLGEHRVDARAADGSVLASASVSLSSDSATATVRLSAVIARVVDTAVETAPLEAHQDDGAAAMRPPLTEFDWMPWYVTSAAVSAIGLGLGIGFVVAADERTRTYDEFCGTPGVMGCNAVLAERESFYAVSAAGFVVAGIAVLGFITVIALDATARPRTTVRIGWGDTSLIVSGTF